MMIYGYIRVSTDHQNVENQRHEIENFAERSQMVIGVWVEEVISSRRTLKERKLAGILKKLKKGDVLVATELSRFGRNMLEVMGILQMCLEKDCQVWTLKENYRLGADIQSKVLAFAFSLAGEIERQLISQRTKNSLQRLRDEGRHLGRPFGMTYRKLDKRKRLIKKMLEMEFTKAEIARRLGCTWGTLHRYIKEKCLRQANVRRGRRKMCMQSGAE